MPVPIPLLIKAFRHISKRIHSLPVQNGWLAMLYLHIAVLMSGLESAYVQSTTAQQSMTPELFEQTSFLLLFSLDILVPLIVALVSRRLFIVFLAGQAVLDSILLHYNIFFYNPLTLSTIYHSAQGAATLGFDIFAFIRWDIVVALAALFFIKVFFIQLSRTPDTRMPWFWPMRGVAAFAYLAVVCWIFVVIYGMTGLSMAWVDSQGHRNASERRMEAGGAREAVLHIGYVATWIGEWMSGTYKDTSLIYQEMRCEDPGDFLCSKPEHGAHAAPPTVSSTASPLMSPSRTWGGLPVPPVGNTVVFVQVESLDFAALNMSVNGHAVLPFIDRLARQSVVLKTFAPHKVGSSNSDYEILNARIASENVMYYSYIKEYPDSLMRILKDKGFHPAVFHGMSGDLFNLRGAYAALGIERFFFKEELMQAGYAPSTLIMDQIKDEDVFDMAASQLVDGEREAQFIITLSSHIPFMKPMSIFADAGGRFARYVSSLRYMDMCLAAYYTQLPEGTVLAIWGDHGSDVSYPKAFPENSRHVPFILHVKGSTAWLAEHDPTCPLPGGSETLDAEYQSLPPALRPVTEEDSHGLASRRIYSLCELSHYLHRTLEQIQSEHIQK